MKGLLLFAVLWASLFAGKAHVKGVEVEREPGATYRFHVTVLHMDEGWNHYADRWQVLDMEGKVLATRKLYHPHVEEQPFTRSMSGIRIPEGTEKVRVRAGDLVHGFGGEEKVVRVP